MSIPKFNLVIVLGNTISQVKTIVWVARRFQYVRTIARAFSCPKLIVLAMISVDNDLCTIGILVVHHVQHIVVVDHASDDDFAVRMGHLPFLGLVVSPLPKVDKVTIARIAIFQSQHVIGTLSESDDVFALWNQLGKSRGCQSQNDHY